MNNLITRRNSLMLIAVVLIILILLLLTSCKMSESVQGTWYAQDGGNKDHIIKFEDKAMTFNDKEYEIKQVAIGIKNGISYYGFKQNGETYSVVFPNSKDKNTAMLMLPNDTDNMLKGKVLYVMNKKEKPNYKEYISKYLQR